MKVYPENDMLVVKPVAFCTCYKKLQDREDISVEIQHDQFNVATQKGKENGVTIGKLPDNHWYLVHYLPAD